MQTRSDPDDRHCQVVEIAEKRRRTDERVEILRMADVPEVHDDELVDEVVFTSPGVFSRLRRDALRVAPVRDHPHAARINALLDDSLLHRLADDDDPVGEA